MALEVAAVCAFGVVWMVGAARAAASCSGFELGLWLVLGIVPAFALADFAAGFVHWFADTFFSESSFGIGPLFIRPFREHHRTPTAMAEHGAVEVMGNACMLLAPLVALLSLAPLGTAGQRGLVVGALLWLLALALTNLFHRWAHAPRAPRAARWLQRRGWILSPVAHAVHHADRFDRSFCVTTGWLNPLLDRADFFGRCERAARRTGLAKAVSED